jgi:hypothetical protein
MDLAVRAQPENASCSQSGLYLVSTYTVTNMVAYRTPEIADTSAGWARLKAKESKNAPRPLKKRFVKYPILLFG